MTKYTRRPNLVWKNQLRSPLISKRIITILFITMLAIFMPANSLVSASGPPAYWFDVQSLEAGDLGVSGFSGLGYDPSAQAFFTLDSGSSQFAVFTMRGELQSISPLTFSVANPLNLAYNPQVSGVYTLDESQGLLEVETGIDLPAPKPGPETNAGGLAVDAFQSQRLNYIGP